MVEGLGRGLNALLGKGGQEIAKDESRFKLIREKEEKVEKLQSQIDTRKKEVEELRKRLTIELMLKGKVDKEELFQKEEELSGLVKEKEGLQKEIMKLKEETRRGFDIPESIAPKGEEDRLRGPKPGEGLGGEIDMRMIKELMPSLERPEGAVKVKPPSPVQEDDQEHIEDLKKELDRSRTAQEIRQESFKEGQTQAAAGGGSPRMTAPKPRVLRRVIPRKIMALKTAEDTPVRRRDDRMYSIIRSSLGLVESGELEEAKKMLEEALAEYRGDDEILYHLGNIFFLEEEFEMAEEYFRRSADKNPSSFRAHNNLGVTLRKLGRKESAIRSLNRSLELNPKYERAWMNLGMLFMELDPPLLNEASIFLRRALECQPNYAKAREKLEECEKMKQASMS
ncbi:MAG: tetratricopeptide repeat protein [Thermoplasmatota archaeon]